MLEVRATYPAAWVQEVPCQRLAKYAEAVEPDQLRAELMPRALLHIGADVLLLKPLVNGTFLDVSHVSHLGQFLLSNAQIEVRRDSMASALHIVQAWAQAKRCMCSQQPHAIFTRTWDCQQCSMMSGGVGTSSLV